MLRYAVMGNPIAHSLSPDIHAQFAKQSGIVLVYDKIYVDLDRFEEDVLTFFKSGGKGLNVTLPFKTRAFNLSDQQTARAKRVGVANTLWMEGDKLCADNTDGIGLVRALRSQVSISGARILLIGAGGAAFGVVPAMLDENPREIVVVNRTHEKALAMQQRFPLITVASTFNQVSGPFDIIINATSSSLDAQAHTFPVEWLSGKPFCYDLAYSVTGDTPFVLWARRFGARAADGYSMLVEQAAESFYIWHGIRVKSTH